MKCIRNRGDLCETRFEKRSRGGGNRKNRTSSGIDKPNAGKNETYTLAPERESRPSETSSLAPCRESKPSRGTNVVRGEQESAETSSFRCDCERCRLMRGAVNNQKRGGNLNHVQTFAL